MKAIVPVLGAVVLTSLATPAVAQSAPQAIDIVGTAEAFCTLPTSYQFASSTNNVTASQFNGQQWTINPTLLADSSGTSIVNGSEVAIRVRGQASCNTRHLITLTSTNGGLAHGASATNPPAGFQRTRKMRYDANWKGESWGIINWVPVGPNATITYDHGSKAPPGIHDFDIRMALIRDGNAGPMLAGTYSDQLIVTISIPG